MLSKEPQFVKLIDQFFAEHGEEVLEMSVYEILEALEIPPSNEAAARRIEETLDTLAEAKQNDRR